MVVAVQTYRAAHMARQMDSVTAAFLVDTTIVKDEGLNLHLWVRGNNAIDLVQCYISRQDQSPSTQLATESRGLSISTCCHRADVDTHARESLRKGRHQTKVADDQGIPAQVEKTLRYGDGRPHLVSSIVLRIHHQ